MNPRNSIRNRRKQDGIALLISIFVLLLISVVAIALIVSSGTESSLAGNYRSATGVYYAALAGLEEARGRLLTKNPDSFKNTTSGFLPSSGTPLAVGSPVYVINPVGGETVAPWDPSSKYPDTEFGREFSSSGFTAPPNPSPSTLSVWNRTPLNTLSFPGPLYKWVRINAVSELSLNVDTYPFDTKIDATPVYYDGTHLTDSNSWPQVLEITSLAVLPNGSQKLLQYLVTPGVLNLSFPAALSLDGPIGIFASSYNSDFFVSGVDRERGAPYPSTCAPNDPTKYAIGVTSSGSRGQVISGIPPDGSGKYYYSNYRGILPYPPDPSIGDISGPPLIPAFQTVNSLDGPQGVVQTLAASATQQVTGPATDLPDMGALNRPVTTIVRGDLSLSSTANGYGLLIVTGNLTLDGHAVWHGVILVIGQGNLYIPSYGSGSGEIDGAVLIANTRLSSNGSLRSSLGNVTFSVTNPNYGGLGFWYNSCWVQAVLPSGYYKILSFHEISQ